MSLHFEPFEAIRNFITQHYSARDQTPLEDAVDDNWDEAKNLKKKIPKKEHKDDPLTYFPKLHNAIFCGHVVADLDSIAGAIGAAHLYGGVAARASDINSETKFALEHWGCALPDRVEDLLKELPDANIGLVDFQQQSQLNSAIPLNNIIAIIDHHALQSNTVITEKPIFVDIRPWGSVSTIIAHSYALQEKFLPKHIAGILLSAILSDTLNLRSPTTSGWDRRMVAMLVQHVGMKDVNEFAAKQFRAKSHELSLMSPYALVNGDMKKFKFNNNDGVEYAIGYSVIETVDAETSLVRAKDIIVEMRQVRQELELHGMLLAIVDIINLTSELLICGPVEESLALAAYGGELRNDGSTLELKGLVSRKKDFVPPLTKAVSSGWVPPSPKREKKRTSVIMMDYTTNFSGRLVRIYDDEAEEDVDAF